MREQGDGAPVVRLREVFRRWMDQSPPLEIMNLLLREAKTMPRHWREAFFAAWIDKDEAAAMRVDVKSGTFYSLAPYRALHALRTGNPEFARFLDSEGALSAQHNASIFRELERLSQRQPQATAAALKELYTDRQWPDKVMESLMRGWGKTDPKAGVEWLHSMGMSGVSPPLITLCTEWVRNDPNSAADVRNILAEAKTQPPRLMSLAGEDSLTRPDAPKSRLELALLWNPFLTVGELHEALADSSIDWAESASIPPSIHTVGWAPPDLQAALEEARVLPESHGRDLIVQTLLDSWLQQKPEEALAFADQHGLQSIQLGRLRAVPNAKQIDQALLDPSASLGFLYDESRTSSLEMSRELASNVVNRWTQKDPIPVVEWLTNLAYASSSPDIITNSQEFKNAIGYYWAKEAPVEAADWVNELPDGPIRDAAADVVMEPLSKYDASRAFDLVAKSGAGPGDERLLKQGVLVAGRIGRPAAQALVESMPWSSQERTEFMSTVDRALTEENR